MKNYPDETFISFIWLHQLFISLPLKTTEGSNISVIKQGSLNENSGPDFLNARLEISNVNWNGSIEIHTLASDWYKHNHHLDPVYNNVILHVVWINDKEIVRQDNSTIPTLEIYELVNNNLVQRYKKLISGMELLACKSKLPQIDIFHIQSQVQKAGVERLKIKAKKVKELHAENNNDWEAAAYILLAGTLGFKLNSAPMEWLARSVPANLIKRNRNSLFTIECLLIGMSKLWEKSVTNPSTYLKKVKSEYNYLKRKYDLPERFTGYEWKFSRTRPDNFPGVRIAQLSAILFNIKNLFSTMVEARSAHEVHHRFQIDLSEHWQLNYHIGRLRKKPRLSIGKGTIDNIIVNTIAPLKVAYGIEIDNHIYIEEAINLLESLKPENNKITRSMSPLGVINESAFESQAMIHQFNNYCLKRNCLSCDIGYRVLERNT